MTKPIHPVDYDKLTKEQKKFMKLSLRALRLIRMGKTLTKASEEVDIDPRTVRKHLGSALFKSRGRFRARADDKITRRLRIFSARTKDIVSIKIKGIKRARTISLYNIAVKNFRQAADPSVLNEFEGVSIEDVEGNSFPLETRPSVLTQIFDRLEDVEPQSLYE